VVPRVHDGRHAFILQNDDGRVIFVIPFQGEYSLIGTTEVELDGDPGAAAITPQETDYLCRAVNRYLTRPVRPDDVVWSYAGVRPLFGDDEQDLSAITRDYEIDLDTADGAPALTVYGGKITTYRRLAEHALHELEPYFPNMGPSWTESAHLPGGNMPADGVGVLVDHLERDYPGLPRSLLETLGHRHGTLSREVLSGTHDIEALGQHFGAQLYAREVDYLIEHEWARTAEDILWRRTKCGLHMSEHERTNVADYLARHSQSARAKTVP
jgi:glycerol-3-phosphate dehydrogenase